MDVGEDLQTGAAFWMGRKMAANHFTIIQREECT